MKVVFATPSYSATPCIEFTRSAVRTQHLLLCAGHEIIWSDLPGDPYVHKARNRLCSEFLHKYSDADSIFLIDDDIGWKAEDALRFLEYPCDIICGIYPKKDPDRLNFPVEVLVQDGRLVKEGGLYKAALAPTGFMRIKRAALMRCADDSGRYPEYDRAGNVIWCWDIFRTGFVANETDPKLGRWWGEDYFFSVMCNVLGLEIWIDPACEFTHRGGYVWKASLKESLKAWERNNPPNSVGVAA